MPYLEIAQAILTDWRAAERDLTAVEGDKAEHLRLEGEAERLRQEYQRLLEEAARSMQSDLPAFPTTPDHRVPTREA